MTSALLTLDLLAAVLVAAAWVGTAGTVLAGRFRVGAAVLGAALLVTAARVVLVVALAGSGWWFVQEKVLLTLPLVVVPGVVAAVAAGPALWHGERPGRVGVGAVLGAGGGGVAGVLGTLVVGYPATVSAAVLLPLLVVVPALVPAARLVRVGVAALAGLVAVGVLGGAWVGSRLPDRLGHAEHGDHGVSVADLRGPAPAPGETPHRLVLTARQADVPLPGGRTVHAWTFDGRLPGPQLTVTQGELVEVELRNADITAGVTIHWHGYPVPAGEDGVAGVTQDAVRPGGSFTYRFRATEPGTYWYHSHQDSQRAVALGLYGVLVVQPPTPPLGLDLPVAVHTLAGSLLTGAVDGLDRRAVPPGTPVRLRLVDTDDDPHFAGLSGAPFRIAAVDGHELTGAAELDSVSLVPLAAGGRVDLTFTMPDGPVHLPIDGRRDAGLLLTPDGTGEPPAIGRGELVDLTRYAPSAPSPLGPDPRFDQDVTLVLDRTLGFLDGVPALTYPVNGHVYPDVPDISVRAGDLVRITVVNRGSEPHPMHPHGHAVLVLSRNGVPASGPLWTDSFDVGPGEVWEVALRADNPGIWMSHCHNLEHAVAGMVLHLSYEGVHTPFAVGPATGNHPE